MLLLRTLLRQYVSPCYRFPKYSFSMTHGNNNTHPSLITIREKSLRDPITDYMKLPKTYINNISSNPLLVKYLQSRSERLESNIENQTVKSQAHRYLLDKLQTPGVISFTHNSDQSAEITSREDSFLRLDQMIALSYFSRQYSQEGIAFSQEYKQRMFFSSELDLVGKVFLANALKLRQEIVRHTLGQMFVREFKNLSNEQLLFCLKGLGNIPSIIQAESEAFASRIHQLNGLIYLEVISQLVGMGWSSIIDINRVELTIIKHMNQLGISDIYRAFYIQSKAPEKFSSDTVRKLNQALEQLIPYLSFSDSRYVIKMLETESYQIKSTIVNSTNFDNLSKKDYLIFMYIFSRKLNSSLPSKEYKILVQKAKHNIPQGLIESFTASEFETLITERVEMGMDDPSKYLKSLGIYNSKNLNCFKGMIPFFNRQKSQFSTPFKLEFQQFFLKRITRKNNSPVQAIDFFGILAPFAKCKMGTLDFWNNMYESCLKYTEDFKDDSFNNYSSVEMQKICLSLFGLLGYRYQTTELLRRALQILKRSLKTHAWSFPRLFEITKAVYYGRIGDDQLWFRIEENYMRVNLENLPEEHRANIVKLLTYFGTWEKGSKKFWDKYQAALNSKEKKQLLRIMSERNKLMIINFLKAPV